MTHVDTVLFTYLGIGVALGIMIAITIAPSVFRYKHGKAPFNVAIEHALKTPRREAALFSTLLQPSDRKLFIYLLYATSISDLNNPVHTLPYRAASERWNKERLDTALASYTNWINEAIATFKRYKDDHVSIKRIIGRTVNVKDIETTDQLPYMLWNVAHFEKEVEFEDEMRIW